MLTGRVPFIGDEQHVKTAILSEPPTRPSAYNKVLRQYPDLESLIMDMLNKDPLHRPTASEVVERLDLLVPPPRFAPGLGSHSRPPIGTNTRWKGVAMALLAATIVEFGALAYFAQDEVRSLWVRPTPIASATRPAPTADSGNGDCNAKGDATGTQPDRFRGFAPGSDSYSSSKPHTNGDFKPTGVAEPDIDKILTRILAF